MSSSVKDGWTGSESTSLLRASVTGKSPSLYPRFLRNRCSGFG